MDSFSLEEANRYFFMQALQETLRMAIRVVLGLALRAEKILEGVNVLDEKEAWQVVVETYASKGLTEEEALQQARLQGF